MEGWMDEWMDVRTGVLHAWPICRSESGKGTRAVAVKTALERQIIEYCSCMLKKLSFFAVEPIFVISSEWNISCKTKSMDPPSHAAAMASLYKKDYKRPKQMVGRIHRIYFGPQSHPHPHPIPYS